VNDWFQTWNRPEYIEWAKPIDSGYVLIIARRQRNDWLIARAKLTFHDRGFPEFQVLEQGVVATQEEAFVKLNSWKTATYP